MSDVRGSLWIDPQASKDEQTEAFPVEGGEVLIAPGQVGAFFPDQPKVARWKDAEGHPDHRPIDVGPNATCTCGWKGSSWTTHFLSAVGDK